VTTELAQFCVNPNRASRSLPAGATSVLAVAVYLTLASALVILCRDNLNVDGVAYLRIGRYYAEGRLDLAVTGYWAPFYSWLLVPWHLTGADPVLGGHVVSAVAGLVFVAALYPLRQLLGLPEPIASAAPLAGALLAAGWMGRGLFPDVLFAAWLTLYFACSFRMSRELRGRDAALTGVLAGVAYLTKYYALPFFALHHTLACLLARRPTPESSPAPGRFRCWCVGMATFIVVAGPWLAVLSYKYGSLTFATTGKYAHSLAGPDQPAGDYWPNYCLALPRAGRITTWENPDEIPHAWPTWSPLADMKSVSHQARLFFRNGREISYWLFGADGLGLLYVAFLVTPVLAGVPRVNKYGLDPWPWRWSAAALAAYLSGLMFVFAGTRRYYWPIQGLLLMYAALLLAQLSRLWRDSRMGERLPAGILACALLGSCAVPLVDVAREAVQRPGASLASAAQYLQEAKVTGPLAANNWHLLLALGYRMEQPCVGVPLPGAAADVLQQLQVAGASTFLLFDESRPGGASALASVIEQALGPPLCVASESGLRIRAYRVPLRLVGDQSGT